MHTRDLKFRRLFAFIFKFKPHHESILCYNSLKRHSSCRISVLELQFASKTFQGKLKFQFQGQFKDVQRSKPTSNYQESSKIVPIVPFCSLETSVRLETSVKRFLFINLAVARDKKVRNFSIGCIVAVDALYISPNSSRLILNILKENILLVLR